MDYAAMVREASKQVGAETEETTSSTESSSSESVEETGIEISSQNAEHIRGDAKSGDD